jgi:hypothetical protein
MHKGKIEYPANPSQTEFSFGHLCGQHERQILQRMLLYVIMSYNDLGNEKPSYQYGPKDCYMGL